MDFLSKKARSALMRSIKGKWTGPERRLFGFLNSRPSLTVKCHADLPGKPDFVVTRRRKGKGIPIAILVEGCFWHSCNKHYKLPKTNKAFWKKKIRDNVRRDNRNRRTLRRLGYSTMRIWEHRLTTDNKAFAVVNQIARRVYRHP